LILWILNRTPSSKYLKQQKTLQHQKKFIIFIIKQFQVRWGGGGRVLKNPNLKRTLNSEINFRLKAQVS
jgi:hypothetical protein